MENECDCEEAKWKSRGAVTEYRERGERGRGNYNAARHVNSCQLPAHDTTRLHNWLWSHYAGILMGRTQRPKTRKEISVGSKRKRE